MKNTNKFLRALIIPLLFLGCNDAIDITQPGRLSADNAFQSVDDFEAGMLAVYNQWDTTPEISLASNFTDEVSIGFGTGGQGFALYDFVLNAGSAAAQDFWVRNFRVNNRATLLLEAAAEIDLGLTDPADQARYNNILAQVYAIRAYANLELLTYFSTDPRNNAALGVPVINFVAPLDIQPVRNTVGECWAYINSDLDTAFDLATEQSNPTFISRDAINALRARAAAVRGDYDTAETLASQLLSSYPIANRAQYVDLFTDAGIAEVIFKLERTANDNYDGQVNTGSVATGGGWAGSIYTFESINADGYFEMDRSIFNALDPNDIRFDVMVSPASTIDPNYDTVGAEASFASDRLIIAKYPGSEAQPLMNDLKVFRSSEMLFIMAEARADDNDFQGVADLIKQLRDARFGSSQTVATPGSQQEAFAAILDEKKIEFAYEGHRYRDLKRLGVAAMRGVDRDETDCNRQSGACTLPANDHRFTLPIPIIEINANPGIGAQQNPGY